MPNDSGSLIIDPTTGDTDRAEDIIMELVELCKKHNCVLKSEQGWIVLAKVEDPFRMKAKAIARIKHITPRSAAWDKVIWSANQLGRREIS